MNPKSSSPVAPTLQEAVAELLPCPFCGEVPLLDHASLTGRNHYWWASCRNQRCTVLPSGMQCLTERDARKAWNIRSPSLSASIEREKRMREALEGLVLVCGSTGDSMIDFEEQAVVFRRETGWTRPGKDIGAAAPEEPDQRTRLGYFDAWVKGKIAIARAALSPPRGPRGEG